MSDTCDQIEVSWRRFEYIQCLASEPKTRDELMEELGVSYDTVYRRLKELRDNHIVRRGGDEYKLTPFGELIHHKFEEIGEFSGVAEIISSNPHYRNLDPQILEGAKLIRRKNPYPKEPLDYIAERLRESEIAEGFTCTLLTRRVVDIYYEAIVEKGVELDVVTAERVVEFLRSEHRDKFVEALESGNLHVHITTENIPFTAVVFDRSEVCLIVFDSEADAKGVMTIEGVIANRSTPAINWTLEMLRKYIENSNKLETS